MFDACTLRGSQINIVKIPLSHYTETNLFCLIHKHKHTHSLSQIDLRRTLYRCLVKHSGQIFIPPQFSFTVLRCLSLTHGHTLAYLVSAQVRQPHNGLKRYMKQMVFQLAASVMLTGHVTRGKRRRNGEGDKDWRDIYSGTESDRQHGTFMLERL